MCRPTRTRIGPEASASVISSRRRERARRSRKGEEEGVALRIDLDPAVAAARLADQAPVLGERLRVRIGAELVEQPRRALNVGEEEGDGARRKSRSHAGIIRG